MACRAPWLGMRCLVDQASTDKPPPSCTLSPSLMATICCGDTSSSPPPSAAKDCDQQQRRRRRWQQRQRQHQRQQQRQALNTVRANYASEGQGRGRPARGVGAAHGHHASHGLDAARGHIVPRGRQAQQPSPADTGTRPQARVVQTFAGANGAPSRPSPPSSAGTAPGGVQRHCAAVVRVSVRDEDVAGPDCRVEQRAGSAAARDSETGLRSPREGEQTAQELGIHMPQHPRVEGRRTRGRIPPWRGRRWCPRPQN